MVIDMINGEENMKFYAILITVILFGCGISNEKVATKFDDQSMICIDEQDSSKWIIEHHMGNVFTVKPYPE